MTASDISSIPQSTKIEIPKDFASIKTNLDKKEEDFRVYDEVTSDPRVVQHYKDMRAFQTLDFYRRMEQKFSFENGTYRCLMKIEEAFDELEHYIVRRMRAFFFSLRGLGRWPWFYQTY